MKLRCSLPLSITASVLTMAAAVDLQPRAAATDPLRWIEFPHPQLELRGLPWFEENQPELWRLPKKNRTEIPNGAWNRAVAPDGGRIRFSSATSRLTIRVQVVQAVKKPAVFDVYIDDQPAGSASAFGPKTSELVLFERDDRQPKNITIYLPNNNEVRVLAVGVDARAELGPAPAFAAKLPLVCYGSSVLQGTGSDHPASTYPAVVARRLNLDFVNLGFGGAGKAEPAVVSLVNQLEACCYLFDLGKSYGDQSGEAFVRMLATIRASHPITPILCVTPIYSTKEIDEKEYREKSIRLRNMMRDAAVARRNAGDKHTHVVEGLELFGESDKALFRDPQHPNDEGNELMGRRLVALVEKVVLGR